MRVDVHTLAGPYALDAVTSEERRAFEDHLRSCPSCEHEIDGLREATARLGHAVAIRPPAYLKQQVMERITETRQLPARRNPGQRPSARPAGAHQGRRPITTTVAMLTSAAAMVAAFLAVQADYRADLADRRTQSIAAVLSAPDARTVNGQKATLIVSRSRDAAIFTGAKLPRPPSGQAYQLWLLAPDGSPRPAGLLQSGPYVVTALGDATHLAVTVEPGGGSALPTTKPIDRIPMT